MSISDPLIREIKEWTSKLLDYYNNNVPIYDNNVNLQSFCSCIEKILSKGLIQQFSPLGFVKAHSAWCWLEKINCSSFNYNSALDVVTNSKNVTTPDGCLRLLIRACLVKKCLHVPIITLVQNPSLRSVYHSTGSIIGDEILVQILLSVLMQCSKFRFDLELSNTSFLDLSWAIPRTMTLELVPCKSLGLSVKYSFDKAIIVNIDPNGVAAEDGNIEVGDVLDELNDVHVTVSTRGNLGKIMRKNAGKPVTLRLTKAKLSPSEIYPPIIPLLKEIKIDVETFKQNKLADFSRNLASVSGGFNVTYVARVSTGGTGDVKKIELSIKLYLSPSRKGSEASGPKIERVKKEVCFEIGEIGVRCVDPEFGQEVVSHSYMEISSCGAAAEVNHYFGYIAGDDVCTIAKNFTCHIFYCKNDDNVTTILSSIGQGFLRTHYAV